MTWTKQHSKRAIAAKARLRIQRATTPITDEPSEGVFTPRRPKPDFKITIEASTGERVQLSLYRFEKQFITATGLRSARSITTGIEHLIRNYK